MRRQRARLGLLSQMRGIGWGWLNAEVYRAGRY